MDEARFEELLARLSDGEATPDEALELARALREDPARRRKLVDWMLLEVHLPRIAAEAQGAEAELAGRCAAPLAKAAPSIPTTPRRRWWLEAVAAVLVIGAVWLAYDPIASRWDKYELTSGAISVARPGVGEPFEVIGEDPAVLKLPDGSSAALDPGSAGVLWGRSWQARQVVELRQGKAQFVVPPGLGAFRVETPVGKVTVLGTEFSVELQRVHRAEKGAEAMRKKTALVLFVAVVVGAVQVDWRGKSVVLSAGDSQAFAGEGEGGGVKKSRTGGIFMGVEGASVVVEQHKEGGAPTSQTIATKADVKVLVEAKWVEDPTRTGESGKPGRKLEGTAGSLTDLVKGRRIDITLEDGVATEIVQMAEQPRREGGEREGGGVKPPAADGGERRREGGER